MIDCRSFHDISCENDNVESATLPLSDAKRLATFANIANSKVVSKDTVQPSDEIPKSVEHNHIKLEAIPPSISAISAIAKNEHILATNTATSVP